jgi:hypothetical protein
VKALLATVIPDMETLIRNTIERILVDSSGMSARS